MRGLSAERRRGCAQPGAQLLALLHSLWRAQLHALLGEPDIEPLADDADQAETNQQACAVDKLTKNFLQACWRLREALVGKLRVEHRILIHEPGRGEVQAVMARLLGPASEHKTEVVAKGLWRAWLDKARRRSGRPSKRQRSAFFVVHRGREPGLFYKWSDCQRSVANFPGRRHPRRAVKAPGSESRVPSSRRRCN